MKKGQREREKRRKKNTRKHIFQIFVFGYPFVKGNKETKKKYRNKEKNRSLIFISEKEKEKDIWR